MPQQKSLQRSSIEAYAGIAIGIMLSVIPMTWWLKTLALLIIAALAFDISFRAPWFVAWHRWSKSAVWVISVAILASVAWRPIYDQYQIDQLPESRNDMRQIGQELTDLSLDIAEFSADRHKLEPPLRSSGRSPIDSWSVRVKFREETQEIFTQLFGSSALDAVVSLNKLGISPPFIVKRAMNDDPTIVGKWFGAIGRLLSEGDIQDAKTSGPNDKLWWDIIQ